MKVNLGSYNTKTRKIKVKIHDYDVWNLDHTLALIIHPCLLKLQEVKHGGPVVDNADTPEELHGEGALANGDVDDNFFKRWDYVLNEMIWAFEQILSEELEPYFVNDLMSIDKNLMNEYEDRKRKGLILFGKYFQALWD